MKRMEYKCFSCGKVKRLKKTATSEDAIRLYDKGWRIWKGATLCPRCAKSLSLIVTNFDEKFITKIKMACYFIEHIAKENQ